MGCGAVEVTGLSFVYFVFLNHVCFLQFYYPLNITATTLNITATTLNITAPLGSGVDWSRAWRRCTAVGLEGGQGQTRRSFPDHQQSMLLGHDEFLFIV